MFTRLSRNVKERGLLDQMLRQEMMDLSNIRVKNRSSGTPIGVSGNNDRVLARTLPIVDERMIFCARG
jgi:hypothetical protein